MLHATAIFSGHRPRTNYDNLYCCGGGCSSLNRPKDGIVSEDATVVRIGMSFGQHVSNYIDSYSDRFL